MKKFVLYLPLMFILCMAFVIPASAETGSNGTTGKASTNHSKAETFGINGHMNSYPFLHGTPATTDRNTTYYRSFGRESSNRFGAFGTTSGNGWNGTPPFGNNGNYGYNRNTGTIGSYGYNGNYGTNSRIGRQIGQHGIGTLTTGRDGTNGLNGTYNMDTNRSVTQRWDNHSNRMNYVGTNGTTNNGTYGMRNASTSKNATYRTRAANTTDNGTNWSWLGWLGLLGLAGLFRGGNSNKSRT